jgi:hypothetical protein
MRLGRNRRNVPLFLEGTKKMTENIGHNSQYRTELFVGYKPETVLRQSAR